MEKLSLRLEALTKMVSRGLSVCDLGCDHGYVSIALVKKGISPCAIAMDINEGPLERAKEHIKDEGLSEFYIETRLSDGLAEYFEGETDALIIAGMGGRLMSDILKRDIKKALSFRELILSPQSEIPEFRAFLRENGFGITDEVMVFEDGKYYTMIKAVPGRGSDCDLRYETEDDSSVGSAALEVMSTELADEFGPVLLEKRDRILKQYLLYRKEKCDNILCKLESASDDERRGLRKKEVEDELLLINKAIGLYKSDT